MPDLADLLADLAAESEDLQGRIAGLDEAQWRTQTPSEGWTIAHQIGHLAWTDAVAALAASDAPAFDRLLADPSLSPTVVDDEAAARAARPAADLLHEWVHGRRALAAALLAVPAGARLPWFGPPMSPTSMATARLMETWAHGQDVADALGMRREPTDRLRHVAHLGVRTRDFAFALHGLTPPAESFRVELAAPSGQLWTWGPADAVDRVTGPALDFCLLVTQRRHRSEVAVVAAGPQAEQWLGIAQAFAGAPGPGRAPSGATMTAGPA